MKIKPEKAFEQLIKSIEDENIDFRIWAIWALGKIKLEKAVEPLIKALEDDEELVQKITSEALEEIGTPKALKAVEEYEKRFN